MRLKNYQREEIITALAQRAVAELDIQLKVMEHEVALAIYRSRVPEAVEKAADKLNNELPGMVYTTKDVSVKLSNGYWHNLKMADSRVFPRYADGFERSCPPELLAKADEHHALVEKRREKFQEAKSQAYAVAYSCTTLEQLKTVWPEAVPVIDSVIGTAVEKKRGLPAINRAQLNATFNLPVEELKEAA